VGQGLSVVETKTLLQHPELAARQIRLPTTKCQMLDPGS
jgi:hypothetical protein